MYCFSQCLGIFLLVLSTIKVSDTFTQYVSPIRKTSNPNSCDLKVQTSLVEHFFNVIFAEFHKTPPVCVCVQMCPEQSIYCYPTGCMKTSEVRKREGTSQIPVLTSNSELNETKDAGSSLGENIDEENRKYISNFLEESIGKSKATKEKPDDLTSNVYTPNPFKDRYKIVFKYRRLPKVEMRYNLREQVKNMKSEKSKIENKDMTNKRWPKGKHWIHNRQLVDGNLPLKIEETKAKKLYMFTENEPSKYTNAKYFKRNTGNIENEEGPNVETLYIYETENAIDTANLSILESTIDNIIESSFEGLTNLVSLEANNTLNQSVDNNLPSESYLNRAKNAIARNMVHSDLSKFNDTKTDSSFVSSTEELSVDNKANHIHNKKHKFLEIISKMSNKIEQQNNVSIDMMKRITGRRNVRQNVRTPKTDKKMNSKREIVKRDMSNSFTNYHKTNEFPQQKRDITIIDISFYPSREKRTRSY